MIDSCLCGSGLPYEQCCRTYHDGSRFAETAEILMRSRFTAYAYHDAAYLLATWDNAKKPQSIDFSKDKTVWTKLEIVNIKKGGKNDVKGLVEFKAYFKLDDEDQVMHELSRFKKSGGRWYYLDGLVKSIGQPKTENGQGKNAPCPCGSGKKFKRCCGQI
ncbi:MAG: YchJ family protein [Methylomicrobium sp.]|nr:YchJ family protein [Methylomicrobium sp.]